MPAVFLRDQKSKHSLRKTCRSYPSTSKVQVDQEGVFELVILNFILNDSYNWELE
jgi:hypothetical protein